MAAKLANMFVFSNSYVSQMFKVTEERLLRWGKSVVICKGNVISSYVCLKELTSKKPLRAELLALA